MKSKNIIENSQKCMKKTKFQHFQEFYLKNYFENAKIG